MPGACSEPVGLRVAPDVGPLLPGAQQASVRAVFMIRSPGFAPRDRSRQFTLQSSADEVDSACGGSVHRVCNGRNEFPVKWVGDVWSSARRDRVVCVEYLGEATAVSNPLCQIAGSWDMSPACASRSCVDCAIETITSLISSASRRRRTSA